MIIHNYRAAEYDFSARVRKILGVPDLTRLHESLPCTEGRASDQDTPAHRAFYDAFCKISRQYNAFLQNEIRPLFAKDICVQRVPTFRVSQPGGTAVAEYHRDSDYNHQRGTVNFWVPLTEAFGTNAVWLESEPDRGDFRPVALREGQMLEFDAVNLRHGNQRNDTGQSRVSFDLRVIPVSQYRVTELRSVTNRVPLQIGEYYMILDDQELIGDRRRTETSGGIENGE